jgi:hypothetical protein
MGGNKAGKKENSNNLGGIYKMIFESNLKDLDDEELIEINGGDEGILYRTAHAITEFIAYAESNTLHHHIGVLIN